MGKQGHVGPSPSEQALINLWDMIDLARKRDGEQAATELARRALAAVSPAPAIGHAPMGDRPHTGAVERNAAT